MPRWSEESFCSSFGLMHSSLSGRNSLSVAPSGQDKKYKCVRETYRCSFIQQRPSHCPSVINEQRRGPHAYMQVCSRLWETIPQQESKCIAMNIYYCFVPITDKEFAKFLLERNQAPINAIEYVCLTPCPQREPPKLRHCEVKSFSRNI